MFAQGERVRTFDLRLGTVTGVTPDGRVWVRMDRGGDRAFDRIDLQPPVTEDERFATMPALRATLAKMQSEITDQKFIGTGEAYTRWLHSIDLAASLLHLLDHVLTNYTESK
jgi:hypothetical protein